MIAVQGIIIDLEFVLSRLILVPPEYRSAQLKAAIKRLEELIKILEDVKDSVIE